MNGLAPGAMAGTGFVGPRIRTATARDHAAWAALRAELWPNCPSARHQLEIEQLLRSEGIVVLAFQDEQLIGFAEVSLRRDHVEGTSETPVPYLEGWYVSSPWRGRGVGKALLDFIEEWAQGLGYRELASDAELHNLGSSMAHQALGFCEVGRSVHFVKRLM